MSSETKALNKIATSLGGDSKVKKSDILNEIADNVEGGGGSSDLIVCHVDQTGPGSWVSDVTYEELDSYIQFGTGNLHPMIVLQYDVVSYLLTGKDWSTHAIKFRRFDYNPVGSTYYLVVDTVSVNENDEWSQDLEQFVLTPM